MICEKKWCLREMLLLYWKWKIVCSQKNEWVEMTSWSWFLRPNYHIVYNKFILLLCRMRYDYLLGGFMRMKVWECCLSQQFRRHIWRHDMMQDVVVTASWGFTSGRCNGFRFPWFPPSLWWWGSTYWDWLYKHWLVISALIPKALYIIWYSKVLGAT